ncbi:MAG: hypothetical protein Q4A54_12155 [Parabacteroides sp.]|nr:hypothetical protein [Parabacteroides sp.]
MKKSEKLYDKTDKKLQRVAGTIGAIAMILGAITGVFSWVQSAFTSAISGQIEEFRDEVNKSNQEQNQALTRVELTVLMEHDPTNVAAIEKMAKYYFQDLNGDLYMTQKYSDWAKKYGGDITIIVAGGK